MNVHTICILPSEPCRIVTAAICAKSWYVVPGSSSLNEKKKFIKEQHIRSKKNSQTLNAIIYILKQKYVRPKRSYIKMMM